MLSWTKLNRTVKVQSVKKLFYNQFLYKVTVYCPGGRLIYFKNKEEINSQIKNRILNYENQIRYNFAGSWHVRSIYEDVVELRKKCQPKQIEFYHDLYSKSDSNHLKFRVEEPYISLYSNDENELYDIISNQFPERLLEVHKPSGVKEIEILQKGEILSNTSFEYNYKIVLKSFRLDNDIAKNSLRQQFTNLQELLLVPKSLQNFLSSNKLWFAGGYFYSKDEQTAFLLRLAYSDLIKSIFKLTKIDS